MLQVERGGKRVDMEKGKRCVWSFFCLRVWLQTFGGFCVSGPPVPSFATANKGKRRRKKSTSEDREKVVQTDTESNGKLGVRIVGVVCLHVDMKKNITNKRKQQCVYKAKGKKQQCDTLLLFPPQTDILHPYSFPSLCPPHDLVNVPVHTAQVW